MQRALLSATLRSPAPAQEAEPRRSQRAVKSEQAPPSAAPPDAAGADQSLTCQGTEKRTRDEGAKPAPTLAKTKRARSAPSPAPAWWAVPWPHEAAP